MSQTEKLQDLYRLTEIIYVQLQNINGNMDHNEPEQIEQLNELLAQRGTIIQDLEVSFQEARPQWSLVEYEEIEQMKEWERSIQPRMQEIYHSFTVQMNKLQQGKHMAQHYNQAYGSINTDGAFFDKRK